MFENIFVDHLNVSFHKIKFSMFFLFRILQLFLLVCVTKVIATLIKDVIILIYKQIKLMYGGTYEIRDAEIDERG